MENKAKHQRKWLKISIMIIFVVIAVSTLSFFLYTADIYHAQPEALTVLEEDRSIYSKDNYTVLPSVGESDTAFVFYPGAKVDERAYLPILDKIREEGITCILVKMPFHMAIFHGSAADSVIKDFPKIENWYIGGHSMGGAMASSYAAKNQNQIKGLILLGAYIYGDYPPDKTLTVYGSLNTSAEEKITYTDNVVEIEGGNHAQFGNYGKQKGDADATITTEEQQMQAVKAIADFIE